MSSTVWMDRALALARRARGQTAPNPAVGAVLVKEGRLIGEGWHRGPGRPHAEAEALDDAQRRGHDPRGSTLWVTLEPCCHEGEGKRTPPCVPRLVAAGVAEVHAAVADPNPRVSGRGRALLEAAGVRFSWGPRDHEGAELVADFAAWMAGRPFVTLKWAQSLEGRLTLPPPEGPWITGAEARQEAHRLRADHDAVVVGAGTLRVDDPALTLHDAPSGPGGPPRRLIFAGRSPLPNGRVFTDAHRHLTWVVSPSEGRAAAEARAPGRVLVWDGDWAGLGPLLLGSGFRRLLVEGGPTLLSSFLGAGFWDRAAVFAAPRLLGSGPDLVAPTPLNLARPSWRAVGSDAIVEGWNPEVLCSPAS